MDLPVYSMHVYVETKFESGRARHVQYTEGKKEKTVWRAPVVLTKYSTCPMHV